jgi:hypothetical protein
MKAVFRNSTISFLKKYQTGTEVPIEPDFSGNPEYPSSGGYYFTNTGNVEAIATYVNNVIISKKMPVSSLDYSKIRIKNVVYNPYHSICVFYNGSNERVGYIAMPDTGSYGDTSTVEGDVPPTATYMLFENNVNPSGVMTAGPAQYFAVAT